MPGNRRREPYRFFNFRVLIGATAMAGLAAAIASRLLAKWNRPEDADFDVPGTPNRPIEPIGTSTAGFVGSARKPTKRGSTRARGRNRRK